MDLAAKGWISTPTEPLPVPPAPCRASVSPPARGGDIPDLLDAL